MIHIKALDKIHTYLKSTMMRDLKAFNLTPVHILCKSKSATAVFSVVLIINEYIFRLNHLVFYFLVHFFNYK